MRVLFFDASALAKHYIPEPGSGVVTHAMGQATPDRTLCLMLGAGEVVSVLVRKRNAARLSVTGYAQAKAGLLRDAIEPGRVTALPISNEEIEAAIPLVERHNVNITDAVLLHVALDNRNLLRAIGHDLVLVASDDRLLKAARAEGLATFNPETQTDQELDALLAL